MLTFFIKRPRFAMVIALVITLLGAIALRIIPVEQYPQIAPPVVNVSASWPGASSADVAEAIATPLETQLNGVDHMLYMESTSSDEGSYSLNITFAAGTDPDLAAIDVQNRVAQAVAQLPTEAQQNGVQVRKRATNLMMGVSLYSPNNTHTPLFVSNYASTQVREALSRLPGVGQVQMFGARDYSMRIWLRPDRMNALNVTTDDVAQALREQNVQGAAGQVGTPPVFNGQQQTLTINGLGRLSQAEDFADIIIRAGEMGQLVRLKDVATIELGSRSYSSGAQLNGHDSAYLGIYPTPSANALRVADAVRAELERLSTRFPDDLVYEVKFDTTSFVAATIKEIGVSLALTLLAVVVVVSLFLQSWRATLIVALAIPVSLVGTFAVLYTLGYSANTLSLFAIILALTMVVDDAIVVVESVETLMAEGQSRTAATALALRQIAGPVIATTLVLLAVFVPVALLPGIVGELYRQFAVTLSTAVTLSSLVALTLTPALCAMLLRPRPAQPAAIFRGFNRGLEATRGVYTRIVTIFNLRPWLALLATAGAAAVVAFSFTSMPKSFLPQEDQGYFFASVQLPEAASLERTEAVMNTARELIAKNPAVEDVIQVSGFNILNGTSASNGGFISIMLKDWSERPPLDEVMGTLQRQLLALPEATIMTFAPPTLPGLGNASGFDLRIQAQAGQSPAELERVTREVLAKANQHPQLSRVFTTWSSNVPQLTLTVDRERAARLAPRRAGVAHLQQPANRLWRHARRGFQRQQPRLPRSDAERDAVARARRADRRAVRAQQQRRAGAPEQPRHHYADRRRAVPAAVQPVPVRVGERLGGGRSEQQHRDGGDGRDSGGKLASRVRLCLERHVVSGAADRQSGDMDCAGGGGDGVAVPRCPVRELDAPGERDALGAFRHRRGAGLAVVGGLRQRRVRADWSGAIDSPCRQERDPDRGVRPRAAHGRNGDCRCRAGRGIAPLPRGDDDRRVVHYRRIADDAGDRGGCPEPPHHRHHGVQRHAGGDRGGDCVYPRAVRAVPAPARVGPRTYGLVAHSSQCF